MAMGYNSICQSISSVDVLFLNHYPDLFNIFLFLKELSHLKKTLLKHFKYIDNRVANVSVLCIVMF